MDVGALEHVAGSRLAATRERDTAIRAALGGYARSDESLGG
jgi:hypothetical protein